MTDPKSDLHRYLRAARAAVVWKLDGATEYDARRPMTPTGTNLLGLVKHVAGVEAGYLGETFGRPFPESLPWLDEGAEPNADLWASAEESRADVLALYERVAAHGNATVEQLDLAATGRVPWWPAERAEVTLHAVLIHLIAEVNRHAGHADVVRELADGAVGLRAGNDNMAPGDAAAWRAHHDRVDRAARSFLPG